MEEDKLKYKEILCNTMKSSSIFAKNIIYNIMLVREHA